MKYCVLVYKAFSGRYIKFMGAGNIDQVKKRLLERTKNYNVIVTEIRVVANNVDFDVAYNLMFHQPIISSGRLIYKKSIQFRSVNNV